MNVRKQFFDWLVARAVPKPQLKRFLELFDELYPDDRDEFEAQDKLYERLIY